MESREGSEIKASIDSDPMSPTKKAEEIEKILTDCGDSDSKLIALATIMK